MVTIIFESHANSVHNEQLISSGTLDPELSEFGIEQARQLGRRYQYENLDSVFCSTLKRSVYTAELAFGGTGIKILKDKRLSECNYGDYNGRPAKELMPLRPRHITEPFPNGKSYESVAQGMKEFLNDLYAMKNDKRVMIVGHRATQYCLEHWISGKTLAEAIAAPWKWRPGWIYFLENKITTPQVADLH